jgi:hypothetical protein
MSRDERMMMGGVALLALAALAMLVYAAIIGSGIEFG